MLLIPVRDREVGLELRDLAFSLGIPTNQIVLTDAGYVVPDGLAEAYDGLTLTYTATPRAELPSSTVDPVCFTKPGVVNLCVYRGDSGRVRVRITDADALPIDITTATWDCDFRSSEDATTILCSPSIEPVVGEVNAVDVVITPEDSQLLNTDCVWDLEMTMNGEVTTVLAGKVLVTKDVSRA